MIQLLERERERVRRVAMYGRNFLRSMSSDEIFLSISVTPFSSSVFRRFLVSSFEKYSEYFRPILMEFFDAGVFLRSSENQLELFLRLDPTKN